MDGEFAECIKNGLRIRDPNDSSNTFWDEWCMRLSSYFEKSNMRHEILEQISLLLSNPGNVVCLTFEAEMVTKYWHYTHKFHSFASENCPDKPGLDIMGLLNFFIDLNVPFWQSASLAGASFLKLLLLSMKWKTRKRRRRRWNSSRLQSRQQMIS